MLVYQRVSEKHIVTKFLMTNFNGEFFMINPNDMDISKKRHLVLPEIYAWNFHEHFVCSNPHVLRLELLFPELECGPLLCALACSAYRSFQVPGVYFPKLPEAPKSSIANDQESSIWDHHLFFWKSFPFLMFFQKVCWFSWYPLVN